MSVGDTDFSPPTTAVNFPIAIHLATYRGRRILAIIVENNCFITGSIFALICNVYSEDFLIKASQPDDLLL